MEKGIKNISRKISQLLRHNPDGLEISKEGWVSVSALLTYLNAWQLLTEKASGINIDKELLNVIVLNNDKKRFEYNNEETLIRAVQGHSNKNVELDFEEVPLDELPSTLYHGTTSLIKRDVMHAGGLLPMKRHHVHLSGDYKTAEKVGMRHANHISKLWIIEINARQLRTMHKIYKSKNGVYLVDKVPAELIEFFDGN